jgi:hypothetical protein
VKLRATGLTVLRYGSDQVTREDAAVAADVLAQMAPLAKRTA